MRNFKMEAAAAALDFIKEGQTIGLGAGTTIFHLVDLITANQSLASSITFVSSSFKTRAYLHDKGLKIQSANFTAHLDIYFDGCDQFDKDLNALKSGGGIHSSEKILAAAANEFILAGDEGKFVPQLENTYPLVLEILPEALAFVTRKVESLYPGTNFKLRMSSEKDGPVVSDNGNLLADLHFAILPPLPELNIAIGVIPGVVEHSLFYQLATKAVIAGNKGITIVNR